MQEGNRNKVAHNQPAKPMKRKKKVKKSNKFKKPLFCCYCGEEMIKRKKAKKFKIYPLNGATVDHVPQQCLFDGYGSEYTLNRITVPACLKCNREFGEIEDDLRDLIGISNENNDERIELTKTGVKSIFSRENWQDKIYTDEKGNVRGVEFDFNTLKKNHIKNFKGVYFKEFKSIVPQDYKISVVDQPSNHEAQKLILEFLESNAVWKKSGSEDIFRYKIVPYKNNGGQIVKALSLPDSMGVFCLLEYHKSILILVIGKK